MSTELVLIIVGITVLIFGGLMFISNARGSSQGVIEMPPQEAFSLVRGGALLVDVRQPDEYRSGHAKGAKSVPLGDLRGSLSKITAGKRVVLICASGNRSRTAAKILMELGYDQPVSVRGGTSAWKSANLPMAQ